MKLKAIQVATNRFLATTTLADLRSQCPNPFAVDKSTEATRKHDPVLSQAWNERSELQRKFDKARTDRMHGYARYIDAVANEGRMGDIPEVNLWCRQDPVFDAATGTLTIAGSSNMSAYDGETQLAARFTLADSKPEMLDTPFGVTIQMGATKEWAEQALHDRNRFATLVSEKDTISLNREGPLTQAINAAIEGATSVSIKKRGAVPGKGFGTTMAVLMHAGLGAVFGRAVFDKSVPASLASANGQFAILNDGGGKATAAVAGLLHLPLAVLHEVNLPQALALGVKVAETGKMPKPLTKAAYEALEVGVRLARGGKRTTVQAMAREVFNALK